MLVSESVTHRWVSVVLLYVYISVIQQIHIYSNTGICASVIFLRTVLCSVRKLCKNVAKWSVLMNFKVEMFFTWFTIKTWMLQILDASYMTIINLLNMCFLQVWYDFDYIWVLWTCMQIVHVEVNKVMKFIYNIFVALNNIVWTPFWDFMYL